MMEQWKPISTIRRHYLPVYKPSTRSCRKSRANFRLSYSAMRLCLHTSTATELTVNEIALSQAPIISNHSNFKQVKCIYACVESTKSWFEVFFTILPIDYIVFPFSIFSQLVHSLVTLHRLSTLNDPAWDKKGAQETADLLLILGQVINNMDQVATFPRLDNNGSTEGDIFSPTAKKFRSIRHDQEEKLGPDSYMVSTISTLQDADVAPLPEGFPVGFPNNDWMMDFLLAPNY